MALTPEQRAKLEAAAVIASGLTASPDYARRVRALGRQAADASVAQESVAVVDAIEREVEGTQLT